LSSRLALLKVMHRAELTVVLYAVAEPPQNVFQVRSIADSP
jgi:hypothetical protein